MGGSDDSKVGRVTVDGDWRVGVLWWFLVEGAVRSVGVVVVDLAGNELVELTLVPDDGSVE